MQKRRMLCRCLNINKTADAVCAVVLLNRLYFSFAISCGSYELVNVMAILSRMVGQLWSRCSVVLLVELAVWMTLVGIMGPDSVDPSVSSLAQLSPTKVSHPIRSFCSFVKVKLMF